VGGVETFSGYFSRLLTIEVFSFIVFLMVLAFAFRQPFSRALKVSVGRYLLLALSFAGVLGLSLRFWESYGFNEVFWIVDPMLWSGGLRPNANLLLNILLYIPPATLLVLARKSWWGVGGVLIALSFSVETIQQYARIGSADPVDLFANTGGALLGISLGLILKRLFPNSVAIPRT